MMASFANGESQPRRQQRGGSAPAGGRGRAQASRSPSPAVSGGSGGSGGGGQPAEELDNGHTVWIGHLPQSCAADAAVVKDALSSFGSVASVTVREKPGARKSWALATFYDGGAARAAVHASHVPVPDEQGKLVRCSVQHADVQHQLEKSSTGWLGTVARQHSRKVQEAAAATSHGVSFGSDFQFASKGHPQYQQNPTRARPIHEHTHKVFFVALETELRSVWRSGELAERALLDAHAAGRRPGAE